MDFIALASATAPRRFLRSLAAAAASAAVDAEDDDFTHLAPPGQPDSAAGAEDYETGGLYGEPPGTPYEQHFGSSAVPGTSSPLLSPSAEAELFLLATNFLLCKFRSIWTYCDFACLALRALFDLTIFFAAICAFSTKSGAL